LPFDIVDAIILGCSDETMKRKLTREEREWLRRVDDEDRAARENMQRIVDGVAARRSEREQRAARSFWSRLTRRYTAA